MTSRAVWLQSNTEHGLAVAFGEFFQQYGLLQRLLEVPIPQRAGQLSPQAKLIEFLVGIMSGIEYLSDLNDGPCPVARDDVLAAAWGQLHFAHYSSVSRTLSACDTQTVQATRAAIDAFSRPFIRDAVQELLTAGRVLGYDLDLMGQPVSATSASYPQVAFGWMDDQVRLGYQLARICLVTKSGDRIWLQGFHHPGDTVSAPCLQELVQAAEVQTGVRPSRRPDLVQQRIAVQHEELARPQRLLQQQQERQHQLQQTRLDVQLRIAQAQQALKRPISEAKMARLRRQIQSWQQRLPRLDEQLAACARVVAHHQTTVVRLTEELAALQTWQTQLEAENRSNPDPPRCRVRMDSGFGSGPNLTWLIEMGYEIDTKALNDKTTQALRARVTEETPWQRVGDNAEMTAWATYTLHGCPYAVQVGLERFKIGTTKYATFVRARAENRLPDLATWFAECNGRQIIEAGNKELKSGVFHVQHLMSHSLAGIQIQVLFAGLAANSVRWSTPWLRTCVAEDSPKIRRTLSSPKHMVRVAANSSAWVQQTPSGTALQFAPTSALPGTILFLKGVPALQLPLGLQEPCKITSETTKQALIGQSLR